DDVLFAKSKGEAHTHSQTKWLKADKGAANETAFTTVDTEPVSCALTAQDHKARSAKASPTIGGQVPAAKIDKPAAIKNASVFVRKLNPSSLAADEIAVVEEARFVEDSPPVLRPTSPALRYGLWWHDFVQRLQWNNGTKSRSKLFEEHRQLS